MIMKFILFEKNLCRKYFKYDNVKYILTTRPTRVFTGHEIYESINIVTSLHFFTNMGINKKSISVSFSKNICRNHF